MNEKNFDLRKIFFGAAAFLLAVIIASSPLLPMVNAFGYSLSEEKKPLEGKYISVLGDSISTYTGWSDIRPITDPSCTNRYGEAYYGPEGGDFHNTDLLVTDTWWHQAATELGAEILMSNAGNGTFIFSGIKIKEGSNNINFNIRGTQNIEKKAYLFLSEVIDGTPSQTMVGIAEGVKAVNASLEVEFVTEIEDEEIIREHFWRTEKTYSITPPEREPDKKDPDEENPNTGADPELA